jgi:hypothetical protein
MTSLEQILDNVQRGANPKFCLDRDQAYDRKYFVERAGQFFDLEQYNANFVKNSNDIGVFHDLSNNLLNNSPDGFFNPQTAEKIQTDPHFALDTAHAFLNEGYFSFARYASRNRDEMLDKLSDKALMELFTRTHSYKTGNPEYDHIKQLKDRINMITQLQEEGRSPTEAITKEELDAELGKYSLGMQEFIKRHQSVMLQPRMESILSSIVKQYTSLFKKEDDSLNRTALINYLKENHKVAEDVIKDNDVPDNEKFALWDKNLKPFYLELARQVYELEKKEYKTDKDKDKEQRKEDYSALGLAS